MEKANRGDYFPGSSVGSSEPQVRKPRLTGATNLRERAVRAAETFGKIPGYPGYYDDLGEWSPGKDPNETKDD